MNSQNNKNNFFKKNAASIIICSSIAVLLVATLYFSFNSFNEEINQKNSLTKNEVVPFEAVNKSNVKSYKENSSNNSSSSNENINNNNDDKDKNENSTSKLDNENKEIDKNINDSNELKTTNANKEDNSNLENQNNQEKNQSNTSSNSTFSLFDDTKEMTWPVVGKIVMDYSMETAVYDKTLEQYRTNDSISISAAEGTEVLAATEGVVERVFADVEDGNTVVINHGNGWMSTYSQLNDNVLVTVGQVVNEGQVIGTIGAPTSYTAMLGSHLDFKITKDNISTDPKVVLAQIEE